MSLIRRMVRGEEDQVRELLARSKFEGTAPEYKAELSLEHWRKSLKAAHINEKAESIVVILVAEERGELVGCAHTLIADYGLNKEAFIIEFYVEPEYRREHLPKKLLGEIKRTCLEEEQVELISAISEKRFRFDS